MSTIVPGHLHPSNGRSVIDWNQRGLIAYACHSFIFIVDAFNQKRIQVIDLHKSAVNNILWSPPGALLAEPQSQRIASADISGQVIISEPKNGNRLAQFSMPNTTITAFEWFVWKNMQRDFLVVLHSQTTFALWNADTGEKIWSFSFLNSLTDFSLDPFTPEIAAFIAGGTGILVVGDVDLSTPPSGAAKMINLSIQATDEATLIRHSTAYQNVIFVATRVKLLAIHQELSCVFFKIEPDGGPIVSILTIRSRDAFVTVTANGACALWRGKYNVAQDRVDGQMIYERVAQSESGRGTARSGGAARVVAASICGCTNSSLSLLHTNGRITFWQIESDSTPSLGLYRSVFSEELLEFDQNLQTKPIGNLSFRQIGLCGGLGAGVTCVRVSPLEIAMLEKVDDDNHLLQNRNLAAIGTSAGILYLVDVFTREILKEFTLQSSPIRCVEWTSCNRLLTAGFNHPLSTTNAVRNDLFSIDIRTGISTRVRPESDESPITMMRVSFYRSYLALGFEREPLEVWDVRSMRLLRRMSRACPLIKDMAWSCKHCTMRKTEGEDGGIPVFRENLVVLDSENRLYHIVVKGLHVKDGKEVSTQWKTGGWTIRCMAWKGDQLAMGDADGRLVIWDLAKREAKNTRVERSPILRMQFSRLAGDQTLAILHQSELILLETESLTRTQVIQLDRGRAALDFDLCGVTPILVTNDNMFWYAAESSQHNSLHSSLSESSRLLNSSEKRIEKDLALDLALDSYLTRNTKKESKPEPEPEPHRIKSELNLCREFHLAKWNGNLVLADLLNIILNVQNVKNFEQLPPHLQIFWPEKAFQERETRVIGGCCGVREVDEERLVERAVVLGHKAKRAAVDRLIGSASGDVRLSSYKAALLVSNHDDEHSKSLIKLIATNLIANDLVGEGVELLFIVGAGSDACRYLQSQRQWLKAAHYAKMGLSGDELTKVFEKTLQFLAVDQRSMSLLWECAFKRWANVRKLLSSNAELAQIASLLPETDAVTSKNDS
ncbi:unnamed protein product, partial [Mesorhabditis belari]|uniref:WDR11 second beta-propeller domain-containing protein n=1 Tax=Mesorhabditis belari TaxID=2138241 RepID=A0AAF3ED62_9BILA